MKLQQLQEATYAGRHPAVKYVYETIEMLYHTQKGHTFTHAKYHDEYQLSSLDQISPTMRALTEEFGEPLITAYTHDDEWEWEYDWRPDEESLIKEYAFLLDNTGRLLVEEMKSEA